MLVIKSMRMMVCLALCRCEWYLNGNKFLLKRDPDIFDLSLSILKTLLKKLNLITSIISGQNKIHLKKNNQSTFIKMKLISSPDFCEKEEWKNFQKQTFTNTGVMKSLIHEHYSRKITRVFSSTLKRFQKFFSFLLDFAYKIFLLELSRIKSFKSYKFQIQKVLMMFFSRKIKKGFLVLYEQRNNNQFDWRRNSNCDYRR